jgi:uncharacterized protein involved in outer membrane biogenesis
MKKALLIMATIIVIVLAVIIITRNSIIKNSIEKGVNKLVGQKLTIEKINAGLLSTDLEIKDLKIFNPEGYTEKLLLEMPEFFADYALIDIIRGFIHFPEIRLNIKQVNVEKDKNGLLNTDHFKSKDKKDAKETQTAEEKKQEFLVNKLIVTITTIRYKDNTKTPATDKEYNVNISKTFTDVSSAEQIVAAIQSEVLGKLIAEGINVAFEGLKKGDFKSIMGKEKNNTAGNIKGLGLGNSSDASAPKKTESPEKLIGDLFGNNKK